MDVMAAFREDLEASIMSKHYELVRVLEGLKREGKRLEVIGKQCGPASTFESLAALKAQSRLVENLCEELVTLIQVRRRAEMARAGAKEDRLLDGKVISLSLAS